MSSSEYGEARWQEVLDGQTMWEQHKVCPGNDDKSRTEYVDPLKALQTEGRFEIDVITRNLHGADMFPLLLKSGVQSTTTVTNRKASELR